MKIKIMLDFGHSPVWKFDGDYLIDKDFPLIDNDTEINEICNKVTKLYSSYYELIRMMLLVGLMKNKKKKINQL